MLSVAFYSSSDDEDELSNSEMAARKRQLRQQSHIFGLPNKKFVSYFRLNKSAFKYVLDAISPKLKDPRRSTSVPKMLRLAATLRILAEGSYQKGAGNDYNVNVSQSTVSTVFRECIEAMHTELCPRWIKFEMDEEEKKEIKTHFFRKTGFPGVVGCIDGTHIKILPPSINERFKFSNRKGFCSLNAMVVCDHKLRIRYVSSHTPGSSHDSMIWNVSDLKRHLKQKHESGERNTWLLGDAGYPLEPYLITPFRSTQEGSPESNFNIIHSKTRNVVERTIGVLKNRFRCILGARQLHYSPEVAGKIVDVCAALHNICIHYNIEWPETHIEVEEMEIDEVECHDFTASDIRIKIMQALNL